MCKRGGLYCKTRFELQPRWLEGGWLGKKKLYCNIVFLVKNCIAGESLNGWFCVAIQKLYCDQ